MTGRTSQERDNLARQNAAIMAVFERAGFDQIAPDIIQPADIFLERSGEDIRGRTFVFNDPNGNELCLRPDLTVPSCRFHLSHAPEKEARYCYLGQAFRFPDEHLSPQEFTQAGCEWFGGSNPLEEEARMLKLAISALEAAGLSKLKVTIGDLGLFNALLEDTEMPQRWRRRLRHHFWRPQSFRALINKFTNPASTKRSSISNIVDRLTTTNVDEVVQQELQGFPLVTDRSTEEIAERLAEKMHDRSEQPLLRESAHALQNYFEVEGALSEVATKLKSIAKGPHFTKAIAEFEKRNEALEDMGLNTRRFNFSANFGRDLEYYTGFVFQIESTAGNHTVSVAGGGRYDDLLKDLGAKTRISAAGFAIHTERLKAALT